jgi:putative zinc finger protein
MSAPSPCATRSPIAKLIGYWLGELDAAEEAQLEEHLFACAECSSRLQEMVRLAVGLQRAARDGNAVTVLTPSFIKRLQDAGVRVREYSMGPGGSILCTVTPDDDRVVAHLHAPLTDVRRLDMMMYDDAAGLSLRVEDLAFERAANEVVFSPNMAELRRLAHATQRVELIAVDGAGDRTIGRYTFNHYPFQSGGPQQSGGG